MKLTALALVFLLAVVSLSYCIGCGEEKVGPDGTAANCKHEEPVFKDGKFNEDYEASEHYSYVQIWTPGDCKLEREFGNVVDFYESVLPKYQGRVYKIYIAAPPPELHFFVGDEDTKTVEVTEGMDIQQVLAVHGFVPADEE